MKTLTLKVAHKSTTEILIGSKILEDALKTLFKIANRFAVITDSVIAPLHANAITDQMKKMGFNVELLIFPSGEKYKSRETKQSLEDQMLSLKMGKDTAVLAIGGGVVTDLAGFIASTYCRGVPFISIPSTLLGMVDASIGGKTGVNTPHGKNLVGAYYQPLKILMDLSLLASLKEKEMKNGFAEIIKYGLIQSPKILALVIENVDALSNPSPDFLSEVVYLSCLEKIKVIESDPKEDGLRRILNFGHTIGHAIEQVAEYSLTHGEAIAIGMIAESYISHKLGFLDKASQEMVYELFKKSGFPLKLGKQFAFNKLADAMLLDKKALKKSPRFCILKSIGEVESFDGQYCTAIDGSLLQETLNWMEKQFS